MSKDFEGMPHTADIKIRVYGNTLNELFRNALIGMFQSVLPQAPECKVVNDRVVCDALPIEHRVEIKAVDIESVLVDFLSEALYLSDVNNEAYLDANIYEVNNKQVKAILYGVRIIGFEVVELKAVTYHDLVIKQVNNVWQADIVFDI